MTLRKTLQFIADHPLTRGNPAPAFARFAAWQIGSRIIEEHTHPWVGGAKLVVTNGMRGATGNIYCGLHEFADMAFVMHLLRPDDLFLDIGANVGTYTVIASAICGARTNAFEPDPETIVHLLRNIEINGIGDLVTLHETALGRRQGTVEFTVGRDTMNHVVDDPGESTRTVPTTPLDAIPDANSAALMKLDVEGYETEVLAGAGETLASSSLLAVETEGQDDTVVATLEDAGFARRWYDPFTRTLSDVPLSDPPASNALFIRDDAAVLSRLKAAPKRKVLSHSI